MGKHTISMTMFNRYVKWLEGKLNVNWVVFLQQSWGNTHGYAWVWNIPVRICFGVCQGVSQKSLIPLKMPILWSKMMIQRYRYAILTQIHVSAMWSTNHQALCSLEGYLSENCIWHPSLHFANLMAINLNQKQSHILWCGMAWWTMSLNRKTSSS